MQLEKTQAIHVLSKLKFEIRSAKERFAKFYHEGKLILVTSVPQGKGDMYVSNQFRQQLKLSEDQLRDAIRCSFNYPDYVLHLRGRGHVN